MLRARFGGLGCWWLAVIIALMGAGAAPVRAATSDALVGTWLQSDTLRWEISEDASGYKVEQITDPTLKTVASVTFDGTQAVITYRHATIAGTITWQPATSETAIMIWSWVAEAYLQESVGKEREVSMVRVSTTMPQPTPQATPRGTGEAAQQRFAVLESIVGDVSLRDSSGDWTDAEEGEKLVADQEIHTGPDSSAVVRFADGSFATVRQMTETAIGQMSGRPDRPKIRMLLMIGKIAAEVNHEVDRAGDFAIRTPNATASVRGTEFEVSYDTETRTTVITVFRGSVLITPSNTTLEEFTLSEGHQVGVTMEDVGDIERARGPPL